MALTLYLLKVARVLKAHKMRRPALSLRTLREALQSTLSPENQSPIMGGECNRAYLEHVHRNPGLKLR